MRHLKKGWKLKRTSSHRKALLRNLAISLLEHKKIVTTVAKAKALRPFVEKIITRAKRAVLREKNGQLPQGQTVDVHARRIVGRLIHNKAVLQELFDTIAPTVIDRPGGYTRIVKLGFRRGDAAEMAAIELVDWGAPQDGAVSLKSKKKATTKKKTTTAKEKKAKKAEKEQTIEEPQKIETATAQVEEEAKVETVEAPAKEETVAQAEQEVSSEETKVVEDTQTEEMQNTEENKEEEKKSE
ncbi:MAG: LSU ribosomal protein L17p [Candidatus Kapaibacterium sp.]|jgi:large subunit ribosomal protein L17|nr:MAG: LSU ribosomal protein L17p [Candidatus Kapabacteria bacterium]ROL58503.1 MAG: 50S ribosomal protein L17 [Bacteroidetes/Chlorobi group bacterium Naka2016]